MEDGPKEVYKKKQLWHAKANVINHFLYARVKFTRFARTTTTNSELYELTHNLHTNTLYIPNSSQPWDHLFRGVLSHLWNNNSLLIRSLKMPLKYSRYIRLSFTPAAISTGLKLHPLHITSLTRLFNQWSSEAYSLMLIKSSITNRFSNFFARLRRQRSTNGHHYRQIKSAICQDKTQTGSG